MVRILMSWLTSLDITAQKAVEILEATGNEVIKQYIDSTKPLISQDFFTVESFDLYIIILDLKSDFIFSEDNRSALDSESSQIKRLKKDCFVFILREDVSWATNFSDDNIKLKLNKLKKQLGSNCSINYFASSNELANLVNRAVYRWKNNSTVVSLENESETFFENVRASSAYAFESNILKLLSRCLMQQNKSFSENIHLKSGVEIDGLAHEGIFNLEGPTLIEIKSSIRALSKHVIERLFYVAKQQKYKSILIIIGDKINQKNVDKFSSVNEKLTDGISLTFWDSTDLAYLFDNYGEYVSTTKATIENIISKSQIAKSDEWKKINEKLIEKLKQSYSNNDLVLFLGAGVSIPANVPCWDTLISKLMISMISEYIPSSLNVSNDEIQTMAEGIKETHEGSPLLLARYIHVGLSDSFEQKISKCLYENVKNDTIENLDLLDSIAKLFITEQNGPRIKAVITYNFDDLLERHLKKYSVECHPIYKDTDALPSGELGIYHVHGFLPQNHNDYEGLSESLLIFSEEGYHSLYLDPYYWSNIVQLNCFRENTCLMIGLSLTDPNLRRLLDIIAKRNNLSKHFVLLQRELPFGAKVRKEVGEAILSAHYKLQEKSFNDLGLNVIWFQEYKDIPEILNSIKE